MLLLARKNLLVHKGRFFLAIAGISLAVVLVLLLMGLYAGWRENMSAYLHHVHTDLWIGQKGAQDLFHTLSLLPSEGEDLLWGAEGVEKVSAFVGRLTTVEIRGKQRYTFIVGVADADSGPVEIVSGTNVLHAGEIIIDQVFARKEQVILGDTLRVNDFSLRVVGIARGGNCFLYQYSFVTLTQAKQLFGLPRLVNYFLVQLAPGVRVEDAITRVEETSPLVSAFSKEQFTANNLSLTGDNFLPILRVLAAIGLIVGTLVIGLTVSTLTAERGAEYGVLKAIGAPNRVLYWTALQQALVCGLCGWLIGVPASWGIAATAQYFVPQFPTATYPHHVVWMLCGTLGMSLGAALLPVRRIAHIDPLVAFKG
ncbi:MAG: ABC transporter permease [Candidatus Binatia bacterium]